MKVASTLIVLGFGISGFVASVTVPKPEPESACEEKTPTTGLSPAARLQKHNQAQQWREVKPKVWINKHGDVGILDFMALEQEGSPHRRYITTMGYNTPIGSVVDLGTFEYLGSSFYKDKNLVYSHYEMAYGGFFGVVKEADSATFEVIGDCYAKDKNHIYGERKMPMEADYKSFKTTKGAGCFAKDDDHYYFWDSTFDESEVEPDDEVFMEALQTLRSL